ncbi:hypothetical protein [Streptomyces sp. MN13]
MTRRADRPEGRPLGDGTLGAYTDGSVTVRADCASSTSDKIPDLLTVTAYADYENISDEGLSLLASLAHAAAKQAAGTIGCEARPPKLPDRPAPPSRTLRAADAADASCAWYGRYADRTGHGRLPDRALDQPAFPRAAEETCLPAVSPQRARNLAWSGNGDAADRDGRGILWASSTCGGRPAVHTLTISYTYDGVIAALQKPLFEAYVTDITERRGCTDVKLP